MLKKGNTNKPSLFKILISKTKQFPSFFKIFFALPKRKQISLIILLVLVFACGFWVLTKKVSFPNGLFASKLNQAEITAKPGEKNSISLGKDGKANLTIPPEALDQSTQIKFSQKPISKTKFIPPANFAFAGDKIYELSPDGLTFPQNSVVTITLPYDPKNLTQEEISTIKIAYYNGNTWVLSRENVVNLTNQTVSSRIEHFTPFIPLYTVDELFQSLGKTADALFSDVIETKSSASELPDDLQQTLKAVYEASSIKSALHWNVSHVSKIASTTLVVANTINTMSGVIIAAVDVGQEAALKALEETIAVIFGQAGISYVAGEDAGTVSVILYETGKIGRVIAKEGFKIVKSSASLQADIAAWILSREMDYINAHMINGLRSLWKLNPGSTERLDVYIVKVDGPNLSTKFYDYGLRFYYREATTGRYNPYGEDYSSRKIEIITEENQLPSPIPSSITEEEEEPTSTPILVSTQPPTIEPTSTPIPVASGGTESSHGSIGPFSKWSGAKLGNYGETSVTLTRSGQSIKGATLHIAARYDSSWDSATPSFYLSTNQQVNPTTNQGSSWYGNDASTGETLSSVLVSGSGITKALDVTDYLNRNPTATTFYVACINNNASDVTVTSVYITIEE